MHVKVCFSYDPYTGSTMFIWKKNGEVELIPEEFKSGAIDPRSRQNSMDDDDEILGNQETEDVITQIEENMTDEEASGVPATAKLQIQVPIHSTVSLDN